MAVTKSLKGSRTEENLAKSYIAESMAYSRYIYYAKQANKEGYFPIEKLFNEVAQNELHHGKVFFNMLQGGFVPNEVDIKAGPVGSTYDNLLEAAREEKAEGYEFYLEAAKIADDEGFGEIADHFRAIAKVEADHRRHFLRYARQVKNNTVWKRSKPIKWRCLVCGYVYKGLTPPQVCPGCDHPYQHYEALDFHW